MAPTPSRTSTSAIPDLDCDYYGASLHKWLGANLGAGILYVRRDRIEKLWPIYGDKNFADGDIRKLNHTGTHPVHTDLAIMNAIDFHESIGIARKEARLRHLQNYWTRQVRGHARIVLNTPTDPRRSCAIANVGIEGIAPRDLAKTLLEKHRIWTVGDRDRERPRRPHHAAPLHHHRRTGHFRRARCKRPRRGVGADRADRGAPRSAPGRPGTMASNG